jgi:HK97 gp10 family phage protein
VPKTFDVKITGGPELQKALEALPKKIADRVLRKALKESAVVVRNAMVDEAPRYAGPDNSIPVGWLACHFGMRVKIVKSDVAAMVYVGPEGKIDYPDSSRIGGFKQIVDKHGKTHNIGRISVASVARFLEYGTTKEKKNPFMSRAWESVKGKVLDIIVAAIRRGVDEAQK